MAPVNVSFWKRGVPIRKRTQSTFTLPVLPSLVLFAYETDEDHRSDRNIFLFNQFQRYNYNFVLCHAIPDYNHGIFNHKVAIMRR